MVDTSTDDHVHNMGTDDHVHNMGHWIHCYSQKLLMNNSILFIAVQIVDLNVIRYL